MKANAKSVIIMVFTLGILFAISPITSHIFNFITGNRINSTGYNADYNLDNKNLKISAVSGKIHIDNNWTAAKAAGICTGNGTYSEPYIIEDLVIDGGGLGSCILIENSIVYFRIENCTVYNSGLSWGDAGIELSNVINSLIITNNCSSNYHGIYLYSSDDNNVSGNTANSNKFYGVGLSGSYDNTISGNTVNSNNFSGISLYGSDKNTISGNTVNSNTYNGIDLRNSDNNIISFNTITHNAIGIYLRESNSNEISNNLFSDNSKDNVNETEEFILRTILIIVISTVIITIVVTGIIIRRRSKSEVVRYYKQKEQEKQLKDDSD